MQKWMRVWLARLKEERGQSIIILAFAVVMLLAFTGMAIDVGRLYGTRIQLSRAVDAAALAGVLELPDEEAAHERAAQFMSTNGIDPDLAQMALVTGGAAAIGQSNYLTVTAQLPMETMFLRFVGLDIVDVPGLAVAEFKSPIEVYASQHSESGVTGAVNLSVFGRDSNPQWGDAFMGTQWSGEGDCRGVTPSPNPYRHELGGKYPFRIHVPANYEALNGTSEIQVEILDPDCWNTDQNDFLVSFVDPDRPAEDLSAESEDRNLVAVIELDDPHNEMWQVRMDQYLAFCPGETAHPMTTRYTLYYYKPGDRTKYPIGVYEKGKDSSTDLEWVVPSDFRFNLDDYPEVMADEKGNKSFFIDIEGLAGTYGNGFDLWAGPPSTDPDLPSNVNERNVYLLRKMIYEETNPHDSGGVVIWAIGYLPLNVNSTTSFTITLGYIPPKAAGTRLRVSSWDMDRNETGSPCYCSSVYGHNCLGLELDYYLEGHPDFHALGTVSCSTQWEYDTFQIPEEFYGGYLYAVYYTTAQDTTDWRLEYLDVVDDTYVRLIR
jgi:hypothetical protein